MKAISFRPSWKKNFIYIEFSGGHIVNELIPLVTVGYRTWYNLIPRAQLGTLTHCEIKR